jgi:hypothetical protein
MSCGRSFHATSGINIFGAQIGGQLWLNDARLDAGDSDRALDAPQVCVNGGLYCNGRFSASGMINLFGAVIGSTLEFDGATLSDPAGKCLRASGLTVKNSVSFTGGFKASGEIDLAGSHVGGELWLTETVFTDGTLDLGGAEVGQLHAEPESLPGRLRLNGLTYTSLQPYLPALQRLEILGRDIDGYQPPALRTTRRLLPRARIRRASPDRLAGKAAPPSGRAHSGLQGLVLPSRRRHRLRIPTCTCAHLADCSCLAHCGLLHSVSAAHYQRILPRSVPAHHLRVLRRGSHLEHRPVQPLPSQRDRTIDRLDRPTGRMDIGQHRRSRRNKSGLPQLNETGRLWTSTQDHADRWHTLGKGNARRFSNSREAVPLRGYLRLSEVQTAQAMDISTGAVRSHLAQLLAVHRDALGRPARGPGMGSGDEPHPVPRQRAPYRQGTQSRRRPAPVLHLESAEDVVIVRGTAKDLGTPPRSLRWWWRPCQRNTPARRIGSTCRTPTLTSTSSMPSGRSRR